MMRVAIVGLGAVTKNIHLPAYRRLAARVRIVAGCDSDSVARNAMKRGEVGELFENAEEMIEKTRPDIVSICTPPSLHRDQTLIALQNGCHVFCEKPMADHLWQADEMINASERAGRIVVVNNQFPEMNIHRAAKKMVNSSEFGRLLYLHASQTFNTKEKTEAGWRGSLQQRVCFEFGIHVFELMRYFFDETPVRIVAHMPQPDPQVSCDAINIVSVEFSDGRAASMVLDRLSRGPERYLDMRLDGERAAIHTSIGGELQLSAGMHTREKRPYVSLELARGGKAIIQKAKKSRVIARDGFNPFASATATHFGNFIDAIEGGFTPRCTARDNRDTLALVFAAYDSANLGRSVDTSKYLESTLISRTDELASASLY